MNQQPATARRSVPHIAHPRRRARSPYAASAAAWVRHCHAVGARLDAPGRAADAVAWCAAGHASTFAIPTKLRRLDAGGVDRLVSRVAGGEASPRLRLHLVRVGEGGGSPVVLACDDSGIIGQLGAHHVTWIAALVPEAVARMGAVVLALTGGHHGPRSRGVNVALTGIGDTLRVQRGPHAVPGVVAEPPAPYGNEPAGNRRLRRGRPRRGRRPPVFALGRVAATPAALALGIDLLALVHRHMRGDWGDVSAHDLRANAEALDHGGRLLSVFRTPRGAVWIITEADRSATTVLLPNEY